jgi:hypothetical protein
VKWLLVLSVLAGCNSLFGFDDSKLHLGDGDDGGEPDAAHSLPPDASPDASLIDAAPGICDPIAQTGCGSGEKCTWIMIDTATNAGQLGCVPNGNIPSAGACTRGPDGLSTGYDNCTGGNVCAGIVDGTGTCEAACDLNPDSCAANTVCVRYANLFDQAGNMGACDFACDPVTQQRLFDGAGFCGAVNLSQPERGCYRSIDAPTAFCAFTPIAARTQKQDNVAYDYPNAVYLNGCAAGYEPFTRTSTNDATVICNAFCRPTTTSSTSPAGEGGLPNSMYTCADRGAAGHECKYLWFFESNPTAADNGIGVCWTPANFTGDWDNNPATEDTVFPACNTLPTTDTDNDGVPQNQQFGCAPF